MPQFRFSAAGVQSQATDILFGSNAGASASNLAYGALAGTVGSNVAFTSNAVLMPKDLNVLATINASNINFTGSLTSNGVAFTGGGASTSSLFAIVEEVYSSNAPTPPGVGVWYTRALNTVVLDNGVGVTLSNGLVTLPAGSYDITGKQYSFKTLDTLSRLYNQSTLSQIGSGGVGYSGTTTNSSSYTDAHASVTLTAPTPIALHYNVATATANGLAGTAGPSQGWLSGFSYAASRMVIQRYA